MAFMHKRMPIQDDAGNLVTSTVSVEVRSEGNGALAQITSDRAGVTPKANPFNVMDGIIDFFAPGGSYRVRSLTVGVSFDERYVPMGTAQEQDANTYNTAGYQLQTEAGTSGPPSTSAIRFDSDLSSLNTATKAFVSYTTNDGSDISAAVAAWSSGTKTIKNRLILVSQATGKLVVFKIGAVTDHTTWAEVGLTYEAGETSFPAAIPLNMQPLFSGPDGLNGTDGTSLMSRVRAVASSNVTLASGLENGDTVDGVTLITGDFVLLTGQTAPAENGIYTVVASGAASRTTAFNTYDSMPGVYVSVMEGTTGADTLWSCTSNKGGTLGTTAIVFARRVDAALGSTDNALLRADGTTGKVAQGSLVVVDDTGNISSFGGQIAFPATQNPSANANTLDDYEEGTYAPAITSTSGTLSSASASSVYYTKVGRLVTVGMIVHITTLGSATGSLVVSLPFPALAPSSSAAREDAVNGNVYSVTIDAGGTTMLLVKYDNPANSMGNGYNWRVGITYQTS